MEIGQRIDQGTSLVLGNRFLQNVLTYQFVVFLSFVTLYRYAIDFETHFETKHGARATMSTISYYVLHTQSTVMCEIIPKTPLGRSLQASHIFLSWFIIILSMAPIN